jgi:acetoin utilization deacetylase AcuC-like enzyme
MQSLTYPDILKLDLMKLGVLLFAMGGGYAKLKASQRETKATIQELKQDSDDFVRKDVADERNKVILTAFNDLERRLERIERKLDGMRGR